MSAEFLKRYNLVKSNDEFFKALIGYKDKNFSTRVINISEIAKLDEAKACDTVETDMIETDNKIIFVEMIWDSYIIVDGVKKNEYIR
jgi:hypothetical protein